MNELKLWTDEEKHFIDNAVTITSLEVALVKALELGKMSWIATAQVLGRMYDLEVVEFTADNDKHPESKARKAVVNFVGEKYGLKQAQIYRYIQAYKAFDPSTLLPPAGKPINSLDTFVKALPTGKSNEKNVEGWHTTLAVNQDIFKGKIVLWSMKAKQAKYYICSVYKIKENNTLLAKLTKATAKEILAVYNVMNKASFSVDGDVKMFTIATDTAEYNVRPMYEVRPMK